MNRKFVLWAFASVFLISALIRVQLIGTVLAQSVGVSVGDWAEYSVTYSGNLTMPVPEMNITWAKITVQSISATNITSETRALFANGTEETGVSVVDVETGKGNATGWFIAANLNEGDIIYTSPELTAPFNGSTINETISRTYSGVGDLQVNHLNITISSSDTEYIYFMSWNCYWIKATGMLTEISLYSLSGTEDYTTWWEYKALITDIIPEFPLVLIFPLFMIVTLTAVWLGKTMWSTKKSIEKISLCT